MLLSQDQKIKTKIAMNTEQEYRKLSFWHDSLPGQLKPRSALAGDINADIIIVGGGYTGLWTAYYLKQTNPSLDISILEAEIAGYGASGRNGGWCSSYLSGIDDWLESADQKEGAVRLQKLMFKTVSDIGKLVHREAIDCHFEQSGALEIAIIPAQATRLREEIDYLHGFGFGEDDYRWLDQGELQDQLRVDKALSGIRLQHCAAIHPSRLARGLAETVEKLGVKIYENSPVLGIKDNELDTPAGKVTAETVIIATEGYSASIANRKRLLMPVHSMMVATEPLSEQQLADINFHKRVCFGNLNRLVTYGQLTADRRIAFGCRGSYHFGSGIRTFQSDDPEFKLVAEFLVNFFPSLADTKFTHGWGGTMGVSLSLKPSVSFDAETRFGWAGRFL